MRAVLLAALLLVSGCVGSTVDYHGTTESEHGCTAEFSFEVASEEFVLFEVGDFPHTSMFRTSGELETEVLRGQLVRVHAVYSTTGLNDGAARTLAVGRMTNDCDMDWDIEP